jgi:hypothetical protein
MMSVFGQVRKLASPKQTFVAGMKTSRAAFWHFCCRYSDSFIDMYHVVSDLMIVHQQAFYLMVIAGEYLNG